MGNGTSRGAFRRAGLVLAAAVAAAATLSASSAAAPGELDPAFGSAGTVTTSLLGPCDPDIDCSSFARAVAVQPDGKIVAAGQANGFALVRYNPNGSLDPTFGNGGKVRTFFGLRTEASAVAIEPDGKILAAGSLLSNDDPPIPIAFAVARYNPDGSLDMTFGEGGRVTTNFAPDFADGAAGNALVLQEDGKVVVAGYAEDDTNGLGSVFALARYRSDGSLDPSFGTGGRATLGFGDGSVANGLALQPDGKLVAVGYALDPGDPFSYNVAVARFNVDGAVDSGFGSGGKVVTDLGGADSASSVGIARAGRIIIAGSTGDFSTSSFALAAYTPTGSLDPRFGSRGTVLTTFRGHDAAASLVIAKDGKVVVGGDTTNGSFSDVDFALARYTTVGRLDQSFGSGGKVTTTFADSSYDALDGLALEPDGGIIAAGQSNANTVAGDIAFAVARYKK